MSFVGFSFEPCEECECCCLCSNQCQQITGLYRLIPFIRMDVVTGVGILACMEFRPCEQGERADRQPVEPSRLVWPEAVDVAGLSLSELRERLGLIKRAEARLAAMKTAALAAYASRGGEGSARRVALEELQGVQAAGPPGGGGRLPAHPGS